MHSLLKVKVEWFESNTAHIYPHLSCSLKNKRLYTLCVPNICKQCSKTTKGKVTVCFLCKRKKAKVRTARYSHAIALVHRTIKTCNYCGDVMFCTAQQHTKQFCSQACSYAHKRDIKLCLQK